ncbi:Rho GTPase activation protein [Lasiosphaeria miniovina]|uniref:Rho GTPase activation protein n=1 Tax=Lasiosphaeria miniovina TaxID=1954250 RepID=A0AA40AWX5_9PEZI|nr:Rho GTPase activation protein [Lasiosphaeria miniovina]KAK0723508.1 Rho GTPase activation protein [Lasiosphaeria miniovina]
MQYAEQGTLPAVNDDVDADSDSDLSHDGDHELDRQNHGGALRPHRPQRPVAGLGQSGVNSTPRPLQADISCRISRIPFTQPGEVPELVPDHEGVASALASPSTPGPTSPGMAVEPVLSIDVAASSDSEFTETDAQRNRKASIHTADSDWSVSELGIIQEEDDNMSYAPPRPLPDGTPPADGISIGNPCSDEWRVTTKSASRRSVNLFSRLRSAGRLGSRAIPEEEFIEKRSLTPHELVAPPRDRGFDEGLFSRRPPPSSSSSSGPGDMESIRRTVSYPPMNGQNGQAKPVFGVDLNSSIRVAPMKIRISHRGQSTSYRTFPICIYKCCEFIRKSSCTIPNLFSGPGNAFNVAQLKDIFSSAPSYGESFDLSSTDYTVYDAARLILLYLEELPKPLIPPSVVRSWVLLARQAGAIEPPCPRVETGLDFWAEALNRLPLASRNLAKHLLTLFAEVTPRSPERPNEIPEADARQLASVVSRALFHHESDSRKRKPKKNNNNNNSVHPTLALAFLIKKRGEYTVSLDRLDAINSKKNGPSLFLPSTKEIMEWKGQ